MANKENLTVYNKILNFTEIGTILHPEQIIYYSCKANWRDEVTLSNENNSVFSLIFNHACIEREMEI